MADEAVQGADYERAAEVLAQVPDSYKIVPMAAWDRLVSKAQHLASKAQHADDVRAMPTVHEPKCDHICLLDDGHVERGEHHFYGYENPSPRRFEAENFRLKDWIRSHDEHRARALKAEAEVARLTTLIDGLAGDPKEGLL